MLPLPPSSDPPLLTTEPNHNASRRGDTCGSRSLQIPSLELIHRNEFHGRRYHAAFHIFNGSIAGQDRFEHLQPGSHEAKDFMHKVEIFDPLPHEEFADLAKRFVPRTVTDGLPLSLVSAVGLDLPRLYFVHFGMVSIRVRHGDEEEEVMRLTQGETTNTWGFRPLWVEPSGEVTRAGEKTTS
eukprot:Skav214438  [mRNA]  locus=scaffold586:514252:519777:+ [translate_table: standard]